MVDDEDAEFLLDNPEDQGAGSQDPLSGLSKESREVLTKIGLGGWKGLNAAEEEEVMEESIKVRILISSHCKADMVTLIDLLYLKNTFPIISIHYGASPPHVSLIFTQVDGSRERVSIGTSQTSTSFFEAEALHQPFSIEAGLCPGHQ